MEQLQTILDIVAGLVGFPALLAALINVAKSMGWLPDGAAPKVNLIAHIAAYVGVGVAVFLGKVDILPGLDAQLSAAANVLLAVLAFLTSLGVTPKAHEWLKGLPVVGYRHSEAKNELPAG